MKCSFLGYLYSIVFAKLAAATNFSQETDVRETVDYTKINYSLQTLSMKMSKPLCQRAAYKWGWSKLTSGLEDVILPPSLYEPFPFSLGEKPTKSSVSLSTMKHPADLKIKVLSMSARNPTLNKFFLWYPVYKEQMKNVNISDSNYFMIVSSSEQMQAPLAGWIDLKTDGSPDTWWVAPESRYHELVCCEDFSILSSTKQASITSLANSKLSGSCSWSDPSCNSSKLCTWPLRVRLRRWRSRCL